MPSRLLPWTRLPEGAAVGLSALAVVALFASEPTTGALLALAGALVLIIPLGWSLRTSLRVARELERAGRVDAVTGLGNDVALVDSLLEQTAAGVAVALHVFALDGLRRYTELFGKAAGDALLQRLARELRRLDGDAAFRLPGARFAVIATDPHRGRQAERSVLETRGEGFCIEALAVTVQVPGEAAQPERAMILADQRLAMAREDHRPAEQPSVHDAVGLAVARRFTRAAGSGELTVAELARRTGRGLVLDYPTSGRAALVAELRPLGMLAIPREILATPGPLDADDWTFVAQHPVIGQRLVEITVGGTEVAALVRSSFEHFDGTGYPDGLAGEAIPIESRIAGVCGAFEAMLQPAPHRPARSADEALDELQRCAGTQFDPTVVEAFLAAWRTPAPRAELMEVVA